MIPRLERILWPYLAVTRPRLIALPAGYIKAPRAPERKTRAGGPGRGRRPNACAPRPPSSIAANPRAATGAGTLWRVRRCASEKSPQTELIHPGALMALSRWFGAWCIGSTYAAYLPRFISARWTALERVMSLTSRSRGVRSLGGRAPLLEGRTQGLRLGGRKEGSESALQLGPRPRAARLRGGEPGIAYRGFDLNRLRAALGRNRSPLNWSDDGQSVRALSLAPWYSGTTGSPTSPRPGASPSAFPPRARG